MGTTAQLIKCVVWDLDETLWHGILLEDGAVRLRQGVVQVIEALDERGILQSIASRNDPATAVAQLRTFNLEQYFLYPQIGWSAKSVSVQAIAQALNIGLDAVAFIDDQPFERDEVGHSLPQVLCLDVQEIDRLLEIPAFMPRFLTEDSRQRRRMVLNNLEREKAEAAFEGPSQGFLATLEMVFTIRRAREEDLRRAEELTLRTNQLNTTGRTYSYDELLAFSRSDDHLLLIAGLDDKYGTYGRVGLALVEHGRDAWLIKLLLMSCRVMSRGVGAVLLNYIMHLAREAGVCLQADFVANERNRMMLVTYRLAGFKSIHQDGDRYLLQHDLVELARDPEYVRVVTGGEQLMGSF
jgi:FkbH-like protein